MQTERLTIAWGTLRLQSMAFTITPDMKATEVDIKHANANVPASFVQDGARIEIRLTDEVTLDQGDTLVVVLR